MSFITPSLSNNSLCLQSGLKCDDTSRLFYFSGIVIFFKVNSLYISAKYIIVIFFGINYWFLNLFIFFILRRVFYYGHRQCSWELRELCPRHKWKRSTVSYRKVANVFVDHRSKWFLLNICSTNKRLFRYFLITK